MTTGSVLIGSPGSGNFYYSKSWNGADGKYTDAAKTILKENAYAMSSHKRTSTSGAMGIRYPFMTQLSPPWGNNKIVELQSQLVQNAKTHKFNMGVAAAEAGQTASMAVNTLGRLGRAIVSLKHGDVSSCLRHLGSTKAMPTTRTRKLSAKDIADNWLELQYGWKPLLSDMHEAASAFADKADKQRSQTVRATVVSTKSSSDFMANNYMTNAEATRLMAYKVTMVEEMPMSRSLGLENPAGIAWELIPYSFVVDWFIPIGSYLENLSQIPQLNGICVTTAKTEYKCTTDSLGPYSGCHTDYSGIVLSRTVAPGISVVRPAFDAGPFSQSSSKVFSAIALCAQRFL